MLLYLIFLIAQPKYVVLRMTHIELIKMYLTNKPLVDKVIRALNLSVERHRDATRLANHEQHDRSVG